MPFDDLAQRFSRELLEHPLTKRYGMTTTRFLDANNLSNGIPRITESWQARAEQFAMAAALVSNDFRWAAEISPGVRLLLAMRMFLAHSYLWLSQVDQLVLASPPLPPHIVSPSLLPFPLLYWASEGAIEVMTVGPQGTEVVSYCDWVTLQQQGNQILCSMNISSALNAAPGTARLVSFAMTGGERWPDDFQDPRRVFVELILKRLAFLRSEYVGVVRTPMPRGERRSLERQGFHRTDADPDIFTVTLRYPVREERETGREGAERKHHWWVQGHYRAQWYPSEQAHQVIYIGAHLSGDLSKPLLEKVYRVAR